MTLHLPNSEAGCVMMAVCHAVDLRPYEQMWVQHCAWSIRRECYVGARRGLKAGDIRVFVSSA